MPTAQNVSDSSRFWGLVRRNVDCTTQAEQLLMRLARRPARPLGPSATCPLLAQGRFLTMVVWPPMAEVQPAHESGRRPALSAFPTSPSRVQTSAELRR